MSGQVNPLRGEVSLALEGGEMAFRPSFAALVAAEAEVGSLFALIERAGLGDLRIGEMIALLWHCRARRDESETREAFSERALAAGVVALMPVVKVLFMQLLSGA
ncbi:GTA-gp10 family protein [Sandaracinobacteroides saxicola]|uniref:Gene transfer agent family protein n=1 Tax=Sandaracinobacteroides saxicola TaxID=2759707 RepID=A0A7G5IJ46_9SPHN|nr:GTA-gp10 family protein [Sandaracinobacteroides saxicola]QMW23388.1 gene transfer agent family protein [Sandaracinobacteroides saxicola]